MRETELRGAHHRPDRVPVAECLLDDLPTGSSGRPYYENPHPLPISVSANAFAVKECSGARARRLSAQRRRRFPDAAVDQLPRQ